MRVKAFEFFSDGEFLESFISFLHPQCSIMYTICIVCGQNKLGEVFLPVQLLANILMSTNIRAI